MKKKLLICIEELQMNGVKTAFKEFVRMIDREKFDIFLFSYTQSGSYWKECVPDDITVLQEIPDYKIAREYSKTAIKYAFSHGHWWLGVKRFVFPLLNKIGFKVNAHTLILNGPTIPGEYDIAIGYVPTTLFTVIQDKVDAKKRLVWQHSDFRYCPEEWQYARFDKLDALVCVGKGIEELTKRTYPEIADKVFTVHNIVDFSYVFNNSNEELTIKKKDNVLRIVTVGRFSPQKNQNLVPKVAKALKGKGYDFEWILIGDDSGDYAKETHDLCDELDVNDVVKFVGQQSNPHPIVKSANLVVIPSEFEGWGLTVTEAVALDVPVIVSDIPVFHEQCAAEDIIPLEESAFAEAISQRFNKLLKGEMLPTHNDFLNLLTKENVKKEFEEVLKEIKAI